MAIRGSQKRGRSASDEVLALGLARGLTLAEAAEAAGVSERTASRRNTEPAFQALVGQLRSRLVDTAVGQLAEGMADAAQTLRALLKAESESVRLGAARVLLEATIRVREQSELAGRIANLEQLLADGPGQEGGDDHAIPIRNRTPQIGKPDEGAAGAPGDRCRSTG